MVDPSATILNYLLDFVNKLVVPLFLLVNNVGWFGLPAREAKRSGDPKLTAEELQELERAVWTAWRSGVLVAVVSLWGVFSFYKMKSGGKPPEFTAGDLLWFAILGFLAGIARSCLPRWPSFRSKKPATQRFVLKWLVFLAVALSTACTVLYYTAGQWTIDAIRSFYAFMLAGYALACMVEIQSERKRDEETQPDTSSERHFGMYGEEPGKGTS